MHKAAHAYFETQVTTTSQADLLIMLYDGAIKFLRRAKEKMEEKDYAQKGILLGKALDIVNELQSSLNQEKGGEIAENLSNLYFFCTARLLAANVKMDTTLVDQVIDVLTGLRSAYFEIKDSVPSHTPPVTSHSKSTSRGAAGFAPSAPPPPQGLGVAAQMAAYNKTSPQPARAGTPQQPPQQAPQQQSAPPQPAAATQPAPSPAQPQQSQPAAPPVAPPLGLGPSPLKTKVANAYATVNMSTGR